MKKLTAAVAALALFFSASAFGPEPTNEVSALLNPSNAKVVKSEKVGKLILSAFNEAYEKAADVTWKEKSGLYFGYFKQQDQDITVAYTPKGELFAVVRQVALSDLPVAIQQSLKENYSDCTVDANISELNMQGETSYYVTVDNKNSTRLLKFYEEGQDELVKKTKKKILVGSVM